jgi:hypothetical protein
MPISFAKVVVAVGNADYSMFQSLPDGKSSC